VASIAENAKLPTALLPAYRNTQGRYIENDTPPLSYSADISDMFLVSFVSMMEHGCQFRAIAVAPWSSSDGCPIEFPFSGRHALQRMPPFTYLAVIPPPRRRRRRLPALGRRPTFPSFWQLEMMLLLELRNI